MNYKKSAVETHNSRKEKRERWALFGMILVSILLGYIFVKSAERAEKVNPKKTEKTNYDPDE